MANILVVDDEPDIREALQQILEDSLGAKVDVASDGAEAKRRLESETYDVVLTDERMPRMRGSDLLRWLQEFRPSTVRILMSAYFESFTGRDVAQKSGAAHFVRKPIDLRELLPLLRKGMGEGSDAARGPPPAN